MFQVVCKIQRGFLKPLETPLGTPLIGWLWNLQLQKEVISVQNNQAVKKGTTFKSLGERSCEIKGVGSQQMAAMMLMLITFCCIVKIYYRFLQLNSSPLQLNSSRLQLNSSVLQLNSSRLQLNSSVLQLNSSLLQLN